MPDQTPSSLIDTRVHELADWRGDMLAHVRALIRKAVPEVQEDWKWRGVPVWSSNGILCTGETYKDKVKLTFARGAALPDPHNLFNSSLEGSTRRAIDILKDTPVNDAALATLVRAAALLNEEKAATRKSPGKQRGAKATA